MKFDWIDVSNAGGYTQLVQILDEDFAPIEIAERLQSEITTDVKSVIIEFGYVDKDYRSTFYGFYSKKGRNYRRDCIRLHFFDGLVKLDERKTNFDCNDNTPSDHYFGYIVLRPTMRATLGRSVLAPGIRVGAGGRAIQSAHEVNVLGHRVYDNFGREFTIQKNIFRSPSAVC